MSEWRSYHPGCGCSFCVAHEEAQIAALKPVVTDSQRRKDTPMCTGVLDYFPDALASVARVSKRGNEKHNPGQPLHWSRGKSNDHADCVIRHMATREEIDPENGETHLANAAWRVLALLQLQQEKLKEKA